MTDDFRASDLQRDELAGVVDLFGALAPGELEEALEELAFKRQASVDADVVAEAVDDAIAAFALVRYEDDGETLLAPGPAAFPSLPEHAEDLPHILEVRTREVDRGTADAAVAERLRTAAARAVAEEDDAEMRRLLDVTYDVGVWSDTVAVDDIRARLDDALDGDS